MQLTVELDDSLAHLLQRTAQAKGETPAEFVKMTLLHTLHAEENGSTTDREEQATRVGAAIAAIAAGNSDLGRNGQPWREFIHEGHKY